MNNTRFAVSMHILTLLATSKQLWVSSHYLAGSINVDPAAVRRELASLRKHRIVKSKAGKHGGSRLARPANDISLADVYKAVRPSPILGRRHEDPNPRCPVGNQINDHLEHLYREAEVAFEKKLRGQRLSDFCNRFKGLEVTDTAE